MQKTRSAGGVVVAAPRGGYIKQCLAGFFGLVVVTSFSVGMGVMAAGRYTCCHRQQR